MIETHPFPPFFDDQTEVLIIGTTPPMRFTQVLGKKLNDNDVDFYYGSRDNYFWDFIGESFNVKLARVNSDQAIEERKELLRGNGIGLADIVFEFIRLENDASDNNLEVIRFQNLYGILSSNPLISKIFFTGFSGKNSAESLTSKHLAEHNVFNSIISKDHPKHKTFKIEDREIHSYSLFSPSPRAIAVKGYTTVLNQYKLAFSDIR